MTQYVMQFQKQEKILLVVYKTNCNIGYERNKY